MAIIDKDHSLYIPYSMRVHSDLKYDISDHYLLSCKLKITDDNHPLVPTLPEQQLRIKRWKRKDHGNPEYWKPK